MKANLLLGLCLLVYLAHGYQECVSMSYYDCTVCYEMSGDVFTFSSCKQRYCSHYVEEYDDYDSSYSSSYSSSGSYRRRSSRNSQRRCVAYSYYSYDEEDCLLNCCGNVGQNEDTMTKDLVNQCRKENDRLTAQLGIILGCVLGGVFLLVGSFIFYKWRKDHT